MAKYVKKPVVVEAWQVGSEEAMPEWLAEALEKRVVRYKLGPNCLEIDTLEGTMRAIENDYIIQGINGELYPCKPDIFKKTYELVKE